MIGINWVLILKKFTDIRFLILGCGMYMTKTNANCLMFGG